MRKNHFKITLVISAIIFALCTGLKAATGLFEVSPFKWCFYTIYAVSFGTLIGSAARCLMQRVGSMLYLPITIIIGFISFKAATFACTRFIQSDSLFCNEFITAIGLMTGLACICILLLGERVTEKEAGRTGSAVPKAVKITNYVVLGITAIITITFSILSLNSSLTIVGEMLAVALAFFSLSISSLFYILYVRSLATKGRQLLAMALFAVTLGILCFAIGMVLEGLYFKLYFTEFSYSTMQGLVCGLLCFAKLLFMQRLDKIDWLEEIA